MIGGEDPGVCSVVGGGDLWLCSVVGGGDLWLCSVVGGGDLWPCSVVGGGDLWLCSVVGGGRPRRCRPRWRLGSLMDPATQAVLAGSQPEKSLDTSCICLIKLHKYSIDK